MIGTPCHNRGVPVDVTTTIEIDLSRADVARYASDPTNATAWYKNIKLVEWKTHKPLAIGSAAAFEAEFLGRRLVYTYEVTEFEPGRRLVMRTADGPFPMETTYSFEDTATGGTKMVLRNRGAPAGFSKLAAPFMAPALRRANRKDLSRLKGILESSTL